ncbi:MAG: hypothetical protein HZB38_09740 [Planctomycetes bacterium]|nr:hypothetical protein [Planctomycetota bacterium]
MLFMWLCIWGFHACNPAAADGQESSIAGSGPRILVENPTADAGTMWFGCPGRAEWVVRNIGDEPLNFEIRTACCVDLISGQQMFRTLAPGQADSIVVRVSPRPLDTTRLDHQVVLETNDPREPNVLLSLSFRVLAPMGLSGNPSVRRESGACQHQFEALGLSRSRQRQERIIDLFAGDAGAIAPTIVSVRKWTEEADVAAALECVEAGSHYLLRLEFSPPWPSTIGVEIAIDPGVAEHRPVAVVVLAQLSPALPFQVDRTGWDRPIGLVREMQVRIPWKSEARLISPATNRSDVAAEIRHSQGLCEITLRARADDSGGTFRNAHCWISANTDSPEFGPILIPVSLAPRRENAGLFSASAPASGR